jgi:hypothetical protein
LLTGEPTGNWHLTLGNPLNPMMVVGNLICKKMDVQWGDELGPDDFPLELKVTYTLEHAMARDKAGIQSMFNRGAGKIYKLPDYVRSVSDYESKVDNFTGGKDWGVPPFIHASKLQQEGMNQPGLQGAAGQPGLWQARKVSQGTELQNSGNPETTFIPKFMPADPQTAQQVFSQSSMAFLSNENVRSTYYGNMFTRKMLE